MLPAVCTKNPVRSEFKTMKIVGNKLYSVATRLVSCSALLVIGALAWSSLHAAEIRIVGSKTLEPILAKWAESVAPDIKVQIATPGTSVAPKAMIQGKADIAAMNREMVYEETENFVRVAGYYPSFIVIAIEAIGIYTHRDNPMTGASYADIQRIFSASGGCLKDSRVTTWGMLGLTGGWANQQIVALGQDAKSPAADFVKRTVQCRDEFHPSVNIVNQAAIVEELSKNKYAVSFLNYAPDLPLKALALKRNEGGVVQLTAANVQNRSYPLQHYLYLYFKKNDKKVVDASISRFLKAGLSPEGQAQVALAGYVPLPDDMIKRQLAKLK